MSDTSLFRVLMTAGQVEWWRGAGESVGTSIELPPLDVWRFAPREQFLDKKVVQAVSSYKGDVEWSLEKQGRNWVLMPLVLSRLDKVTRDEYVLRNQDFVKQANADYIRLVSHIKEYLG